MATLLRADALPSASHSRAAPDRTAEVWTDSEYGVLEQVLVASPRYLSLVPCNEVSEAALGSGRLSCTASAATQHETLVAALTSAGVDVRIVAPRAGQPDLAFTRDSSFMTPWGLVGLRPGAEHRRGEVDTILDFAQAEGMPILGRLAVGRVEGGDVCLLRPGHVAIGISGERTDTAGARALGDLFERRGWSVIETPIDPRLLHLDTHFCMLDRGRALGCLEALAPSFVEQVRNLGIEIIPITVGEIPTLGGNVLALGRRRILSTGSAPRVDEVMRKLGFDVTTVALGEFTQCGGGIHCLTMPLRRQRG